MSIIYPITDDVYLTVEDVATRFRVSTMTIYRMVDDHLISAVRVGRSIRILESEVERYVKENTSEVLS